MEYISKTTKLFTILLFLTSLANSSTPAGPSTFFSDSNSSTLSTSDFKNTTIQVAIYQKFLIFQDAPLSSGKFALRLVVVNFQKQGSSYPLTQNNVFSNGSLHKITGDKHQIFLHVKDDFLFLVGLMQEGVKAFKLALIVNSAGELTFDPVNEVIVHPDTGNAVISKVVFLETLLIVGVDSSGDSSVPLALSSIDYASMSLKSVTVSSDVCDPKMSGDVFDFIQVDTFVYLYCFVASSKEVKRTKSTVFALNFDTVNGSSDFSLGGTSFVTKRLFVEYDKSSGKALMLVLHEISGSWGLRLSFIEPDSAELVPDKSPIPALEEIDYFLVNFPSSTVILSGPAKTFQFKFDPRSIEFYWSDAKQIDMLLLPVSFPTSEGQIEPQVLKFRVESDKLKISVLACPSTVMVTDYSGCDSPETVLTSYLDSAPFNCTGGLFLYEQCSPTCARLSLPANECVSTCQNQIEQAITPNMTVCSSKCALTYNSTNSFFSNNNCVSACSTGFFNENRECLESCPTSKFRHSSGLCTETCGLASVMGRCAHSTIISDPKKTLDLDTFSFVDTCSKNVTEDSKYCVSDCVLEYPYKHASESKCLRSCTGIHVYPDSSNTCHFLDNCTLIDTARLVCVDSCPEFVNGKECQSSCPTSTKIYIHPSGKKECVQNCPSGVEIDQKTCIKQCSTGEFVLPEHDSCISSCEEAKLKEVVGQGYCTANCGNLKEVENKCYSNCPSSPFRFEDSEGKCVAECPSLHVAGTGLCVSSCPESAPILAEKSCVTACSGLMHDNKCLSECPVGLYTHDSKCVSTCTELAFEAKDGKLYCLDSCPANYAASEHKCYLVSVSPKECAANEALVRGECLKCANIGQVERNGVCVPECSAPFVLPVDGECRLCTSADKLLLYDSCVFSCPPRFVADKGTCSDCFDKWVLDRECIDDCPYFKYRTPYAKHCINCKSNEFFYEGDCLPRCSPPLMPDFTNRICIDTKSALPCLNGALKDNSCYCNLGFAGLFCQTSLKNIEIGPFYTHLYTLSLENSLFPKAYALFLEDFRLHFKFSKTFLPKQAELFGQNLRNKLESLDIPSYLNLTDILFLSNVISPVFPSLNQLKASRRQLQENNSIVFEGFSFSLVLTNEPPTANTTECDAVLRASNGFSSDLEITYKVFQFSEEVSSAVQIPAKALEINTNPLIYVEASTESTPLELDSTCTADQIDVNYIVDKSDAINLDQVNDLNSLGVNLFDSEDSFFHDKCFPYSKEGKDITLSTRQTDYFEDPSELCNETANQVCSINEFSLNGQVRCYCRGIKTADKPSNVFESSYSDSNYEVYLCWNTTINGTLGSNVGFLFMGFLQAIFLFWALANIAIFNSLIYSNNIYYVIRNDCLIFGGSPSKIADYFHRYVSCRELAPEQQPVLPKTQAIVTIEDDLSNDIVPERFKKIGPTLPDMQALPLEMRSQVDKRNFISVLKDTLIRQHKMLGLLFFYSMKKPKFYRILTYLTSLSFKCALNAFFYDDELIRKRNDASEGNVKR